MLSLYIAPLLLSLALPAPQEERDLKKMVSSSDERLRRAAVRACRVPVLADEGVFSRFVELVEPILEGEDEELMVTVDELLAAVATEHAEAVAEIAEPQPQDQAAAQEGR